MIRQILLPLQTASSASMALDVACNLAALAEARLVGLYVEDERLFFELPLTTAIAENVTGNPLIGSPLPPDKVLQVEERVENEARELFKSFDAACSGRKVSGQFLTLRGNPLHILVERAKSTDIMVLGRPAGAEGGTSVPEVLPSLLRETTRPVLLVGQHIERASTMLIAYDGSRAAERVLAVAAEFAELSEIEQVHLLTVHNDPEAARAIQIPAHEFLSAYRFELVDMWVAGKPADAIREYAVAVNAGVVAMGAFGSNRLSELIFGSTTQHLLQELDFALLIVP